MCGVKQDVCWRTRTPGTSPSSMSPAWCVASRVPCVTVCMCCVCICECHVQQHVCFLLLPSLHVRDQPGGSTHVSNTPRTPPSYTRVPAHPCPHAHATPLTHRLLRQCSATGPCTSTLCLRALATPSTPRPPAMTRTRSSAPHTVSVCGGGHVRMHAYAHVFMHVMCARTVCVRVCVSIRYVSGLDQVFSNPQRSEHVPCM